MPTVEIVRFLGSDEFVADNLVLKDALSIVAKTEGCIRPPYYGIQTEDNRTGYGFVIWESYEHHMKARKKDSYPALLAALKRAHSGPSDVQHADFDVDVEPALDSPVTEVVTLVRKPDVSEKEAMDLVTKLREAMIAQGACHSVTVGESRENKGTLFLLLGWESVQAHYDAVSKGALPEIIKELYLVNELELKHVKLTKYVK
ncbi:hypothetical protein C0989_003912 [Termitomyces sp. Mn162]|nr:hypothetical protein C0989_003912 [Termitomyces sp. Mn162]